MSRISAMFPFHLGYDIMDPPVEGQGMYHLPFRVPNVYKGLAKTEGIAHFSKDLMALEFETKDKIVGIIKSGPKKIAVAPKDIHSIDLKRGLGKVRLLLHSVNMNTFSSVPGYEGTALTLIFPSRCRDDLKLIVSEIKVRLADNDIRRAEDNSG